METCSDLYDLLIQEYIWTDQALLLFFLFKFIYSVYKELPQISWFYARSFICQITHNEFVPIQKYAHFIENEVCDKVTHNTLVENSGANVPLQSDFQLIEYENRAWILEPATQI